MMKCPAIVLSLSCVLILIGNMAVAGTLTASSAAGFVPSVQAEAACPKIGSLIRGGQTMTINDDLVTVQEIDNSGTRRTILSGVVFDLELSKQDKDTHRIKGYCFFNSGERLGELLGADATTNDMVLTRDGRMLKGKISSLDRNQLTLIDGGVAKQLPISQIQKVLSSRVYIISALLFVNPSIIIDDKAAFEAKMARFELDQTLDELMTAAGRKRLEAAVSARGYTRIQKTVLIGTSVFVTAAAIAIPVALAVPLAGRQRGARPETEQVHLGAAQR